MGRKTPFKEAPISRKIIQIKVQQKISAEEDEKDSRLCGVLLLCFCAARLKAATQLKEEESPIKLGKVDATIHSELASNYEVRGYPPETFRNGKPTEYGGGRDAASIVAWLKKKTDPVAKELKTADEIKDFQESAEVAACLLQTAEDAKDSWKWLPPLMTFHLPLSTKKFDDGRVQFEDKLAADTLRHDPGQQTTLVQNSARKQLHHLRWQKSSLTTAVLFQRAADFEKLRVSSAPLPKRVQKEKRIVSSLPHIRWQVETTFDERRDSRNWDKTPVKTWLGKNFEELHARRPKDVLVEFYAPCADTASNWCQSGKNWENNTRPRNIVIAKMDSTANEVEDVKVQSFPTIKGFNQILESGGKDVLACPTLRRQPKKQKKSQKRRPQ
uniref:Thioredoxin domain-containing protein n=1 Tax=Ditylenchus dipsaci TaxID=166011 RepID=A0A915CZF6_9BILA